MFLTASYSLEQFATKPAKPGGRIASNRHSYIAEHSLVEPNAILSFFCSSAPSGVATPTPLQPAAIDARTSSGVSLINTPYCLMWSTMCHKAGMEVH